MDTPLTLLDVAKATEREELVPLIEKSQVVAPELQVVKGMGIAGTSYNIHRRDLPTSVAFRAANQGQAIGKSNYETELQECFILSAEMEVDTAVAAADPHGEAACVEREAIGYMRAALIAVSKQFYYGNSPVDKGFKGIATLLPSLNPPAGIPAANYGIVVDGLKHAGSVMSVYLAHVDENGLQFIFGKNGQIELDPLWRKQQVMRTNPDGSLSKLTAWVNNLMMWLGLQIGHPQTIARICNLDPNPDSTTNNITDALMHDAIRQFPLDKQPTHIFMNRPARHQLQASRSAITTRLGQANVIWAPQPDESNGIPIVLTDGPSITETVVS
jgi:hypothetical protein